LFNYLLNNLLSNSLVNYVDNMSFICYNIIMKTMTVANLKADFSAVIDDLKKGDEVVIEYGKRHEKLAVIVPYKKYKRSSRKIGILKGKASFKMNAGFKMSAEDLLNL